MGNFILGIIIGGAFLFFYFVNGGSDNSTENTNSNPEVNSEWVSPTEDVCTSNGGKFDNGICEADWQNAKSICQASGARLPTIDELQRVVTSCGGVVDDHANNENDPDYQSCYKRRGFDKGWYWSSTEYNNISSYAWIVYFYYGDVNGYDKGYNIYPRCVRAGQ